MSQLSIGIGSRRNASAALALLVLAVALIYLPDIGHGFIRDDFMWLRVGRLATPSDVPRLLTTNTGFYRPLVLASFGIEYALFGLHAYPFALTNLLLLFACAILVMRVCRALALTTGTAVAAAGAWLLNFHAIGMSLLWLSGRTALLVCLFSLLAALATMAGRRWWAGVWCLLALLSKEEAVAIPFLLAAWIWYLEQPRGGSSMRGVIHRTWPMFVALAIYAVLRLNSGAFTPTNAPSYYRFTTSVPLLLRNAGEYVDRGCTLSLAVVLVVFAAVRRRPSITPVEASACVFGAIWFVAGVAITVFLPVRSDLYALNPSIGAALAAGAMVQAFGRAAPSVARRTLIGLLLLPFVLIPVYRQRNVRWVTPADISAQVLANVTRDAATLPDGTHLVLVDSPADGRPLRNAFGDLLPDAIALAVGRGFTGEILDEAAGTRVRSPAGQVLYGWRAGEFQRLNADVR